MEALIGEPGGITFALTALHWRFKENIIFGGDEPEIQFGRLPLNTLTSIPGEDLWEANSETGHSKPVFFHLQEVTLNLGPI